MEEQANGLSTKTNGESKETNGVNGSSTPVTGTEKKEENKSMVPETTA